MIYMDGIKSCVMKLFYELNSLFLTFTKEESRIKIILVDSSKNNTNWAEIIIVMVLNSVEPMLKEQIFR